MQILLDTHTYLWFINGDKQLSEKAKKIITDNGNEIFVSIVSLWEISIKLKTDKLKLDFSFSSLREKLNKDGFKILPVSFSDTETILSLPLHHRDPFDRMLIAQSINNNLTIISRDKNFKMYSIKLVW